MKKSAYLLLGIFVLFTLFSSCSYFRISKSATALVKNIEQPTTPQKRYILHTPGRIFEINDIRIESNIISGKLKNNPKNVIYTPGRTLRRTNEEKDILNEVHIYLKESVKLQNGLLDLPISDIHLVQIIKPDNLKQITIFTASGISILGIIFLIFPPDININLFGHLHFPDGHQFIFSEEILEETIAHNFDTIDNHNSSTVRILELK